MLEQLCAHLHNYFERHPVSHNRIIFADTYTIEDGSLSLPFLLSGQKFRIKGSALNDGVYTYGETIQDDDGTTSANLSDETFDGEIWAMYPPKAVLALAGEIADWIAKYGAAADSPYQSESFGGYSYAKATGAANTNGGASAGTWQGIFSARLNEWRKVASE